MFRSRIIWIGAVTAALLVIACNDPPQSLTSVDGTIDQVATATADRQSSRSQIPFSKLKMFLEFNSTDDDLGVQLLLDGDDWQRIEGRDPRGREFVEVEAGGRLRELGITELFWESAEPSPAEVLATIPAGTYNYSGTTVDGERLVGSATLSHTLPTAPRFSPQDGAIVDATNFVITWQPIAGLASFQVIVADETAGREMVVDLAPNVTSLRVPTEFARPGVPYKIEVLAVASNGNKTITEATIQTK